MWIGEYGLGARVQNHDAWLEDVVSLLDTHDLSRTHWEYHWGHMAAADNSYNQDDLVHVGRHHVAQRPLLGTRVDFDVYVPPGQPQPSWFGAVQLFITIPSAQIVNSFIGHVELTPAGTGWRTASFTLPTQVHRETVG